jgi:hypothetical protein
MVFTCDVGRVAVCIVGDFSTMAGSRKPCFYLSRKAVSIRAGHSSGYYCWRKFIALF